MLSKTFVERSALSQSQSVNRVRAWWATTVFVALAGAGLVLAAPAANAQDVKALVPKVRPSVVYIKVNPNSAKPSAGSGVIITKDGFVLTVKHLFPADWQANPPAILGSRKSAEVAGDPMEIVKVDPTFDVALLRFRNTAVSYDSASVLSAPLNIGEFVLKLGFPLGQEFEAKDGRVSGVGRQGFLLSNLVLNPGDSGSPVVDDQGRLRALVVEDLGAGTGLSILLPVRYAPNLLQIAGVVEGSVAPAIALVDLRGRIYGTYHNEEAWTDTFKYSRSDPDCAANYPDDQEFCAPEGVTVLNSGSLVRHSENCNSSIGSPRMISPRCVKVPARLAGCGYNAFGLNCQGRGWFDYSLTLVGRRTNEVQIASHPINVKASTDREFIITHPLAATSLAGAVWRYELDVVWRGPGAEVRNAHAESGKPPAQGVAAHINNGSLTVSVSN